MLSLVRLMQLVSPTLPVGAYTYSQGLEWVAESGIVHDETSARGWIGDVLSHGVAQYEAPLVAALMRAWAVGDDEQVARLDADFVASRETSELRAETLQMGYSAARLLRELDAFATLDDWGGRLAGLPEPSFPAVWSAAACAWAVPLEHAVTGYLWAWLENQVMAAVKTVPLGQSAGQRLLSELGERIPALARQALVLPEDEWSNFTPGLALASCRHETQYTRLFRS